MNFTPAFQNMQHASSDISLLTPDDLFLFNEGTHYRLYDKLGCRPLRAGGRDGYYFAMWAPNATTVSVMGDFNGWSVERHPLQPKGKSGIWETFIPGVRKGSRYKYHIFCSDDGYHIDKSDPFALYNQAPPETASIAWNLQYEWYDQEWMSSRVFGNSPEAPISIYEVHLGSWKRAAEADNRPLGYRELAIELVNYICRMGFTHVEFLPLTEHPFYGSWGYQGTGYFAPTSRYGTPQDFMFLVDELHRQGIGVILDWVPSHFSKDAHGLARFDGTRLYEHEDIRLGWHPDWDSFIFNYGRHEVRSFLISNALFWLDKYHIDGLRVDAVASMLYLDYSRKEGEWLPNIHGGRENLEAIAFLRRMNEVTHENYPDALTIAEESTDWPMVSRPVHLGGLGFDMKWDMGWMHDTLKYMARDPVFRSYHHNDLTFRMLYAFNENFLLPLSHDEVVHGKGSLLAKMPGKNPAKHSGLRLLFGYMYTQPGKKLLFMGSELGPWSEWNHDEALPWELLQQSAHAGLQRWIRDLNALYRGEPALYRQEFDSAGFEWIDCSDVENSVVSYLRKSGDGSDVLLVVCNFTPVPHFGYRVGVPAGGFWREILNSDALDYGGDGYGNLGGADASAVLYHDRPYSISLTLPPLAVVVLKPTAQAAG